MKNGVIIMDNKLKDVKTFLKKSPEELQEYMAFQRRGSVVPSKKGRGSYTRKKKHKNQEE